MMVQKLDILFVQEHNVKNISQVEYIKQYCDVVLNSTSLLKGGTAILINRKSNVKILQNEMDVKGCILSLKCNFLGTDLQLINVYAPSGNDKKLDREELFKNDLLYYCRNNLQNLIIGGDWNAITSQRDCSNPENNLLSKSLSMFKNNLKLKDVWLLTNHNIEYTYVKKDYGSRLDRIYVRDLSNNVQQTENIPVAWSDHNVIKTTIILNNELNIGKGYWKLNCSVLMQDIVTENFVNTWEKMKRNISKNGSSILEWWISTKGQLKNFFIRCSKIINQEKYGTLNILKYLLKREYELHSSNCSAFEKINSLKERIKMIEDDICEGLSIRAKIEDSVKGEKMSSYLLAKEKNAKTTITKLRSQNGTLLTNNKAIQLEFHRFYKELYSKGQNDVQKQEEFLDKLQKVLGEKENKILTDEVTESEVWEVIKGMKNGKCPGIDGLPVEFYK